MDTNIPQSAQMEVAPIEIKYNVHDEYEPVAINQKVRSVLVSSDDATSCNTLYVILTSVFQNNNMVFRASGLPNNIDDVMELIAPCNMAYFEGDRNKFYIRKFPELHVEITGKAMLKSVLNNWVSFTTEQRLLYILKKGQLDNVLNKLEKNIYSDSSPIHLLWSHLNCIVKSVPEAENQNTFILIFREEYFDEINAHLLFGNGQ